MHSIYGCGVVQIRIHEHWKPLIASFQNFQTHKYRVVGI